MNEIETSIQAEDNAVCTVNGESTVMGSGDGPAAATVISAGTASTTVSNGGIKCDSQQQQHSNAVIGIVTAEPSKPHHSTTSVSKHSSSSSHHHKSRSSHDQSRSSEGHRRDDHKKSEGHKHRSHSSSHRSSGDPKAGHGHSSQKSSTDPVSGHSHSNEIKPSGQSAAVKQSGQGQKDHSSSSSKHHHRESSSSDPNKHHHHHHRTHSSSDVKKSSDVKTSSSSDANKHHHRSHSSADAKKVPSSSSSLKTQESGTKKPEEQTSFLLSPLVIKKEPASSPSKPDHVAQLKKKVDVDGKTQGVVVGVVKAEVKMEVDEEEEDLPLSMRMKQEQNDTQDNDEKPLFERTKKRKRDDSGDDSDTPLAARLTKKVKVEGKKKRKQPSDNDDEVKVKMEDGAKKPRGKKSDKAEEDTRWKWWEEEPREEGVKWRTLEHRGPVFAEAYQRLPSNVKFYYNGRHMVLSDTAEEVAGFYARMLDHEYTTRQIFNTNFMKDWRKVMNKQEREVITDMKKCNFKELAEHFKLKSEERKNMSKEEKQAIKVANEKVQKEYGFCIIDGHKQKIGNFKIEPPGLFRGRGDHPKQGMLKRRVMPEDVIINCSKGSDVPSPPAGHRWKEVRHDNTVTWLASWIENVQGQVKYIMLNAASKLKGEKDWMKYETARKLHKLIRGIRENYREDWKSKEMKIRQRAVALYFIDKLALRAGNEKDEDQADTVGCCSLRVEHIKLHEEYDGKEFVVEFDFLGKDSIRYYNRVEVEKRVFKNLQLFMENKQDGDDLFDRLNTSILNKHLQQLMDGLTAKVFRTYNASHTLQQQLDQLASQDADEEDFESQPVAAKLLAYNRANRTVAVLCNHQRAVPKNFDKQMENLQTKIDAKKEQLHDVKKDFKSAKSDYKAHKTESAKAVMTKKQRAVDRVKEQLDKLLLQQTDKDENKEIALGTSKLNYLDPRITIAWCKKWLVPIEKVYNKTQREKFAWAIDMADEDYSF